MKEFYGIDKSNDISLFEYGLLVSKDENEDGSETHFIIYKIDDDSFGTGHISEREINGYVEGKEFMDKKDIKSFLSFVGMKKKAWLKENMVNKLHDLLSYWGVQNIMGTDYFPWTEYYIRQEYSYLFN